LRYQGVQVRKPQKPNILGPCEPGDGDRPGAVEEHEAIYRAIRDGRPEEAAEATAAQDSGGLPTGDPAAPVRIAFHVGGSPFPTGTQPGKAETLDLGEDVLQQPGGDPTAGVRRRGAHRLQLGVASVGEQVGTALRTPSFGLAGMKTGRGSSSSKTDGSVSNTAAS
jgi:hypothetical protein